MYESLGLTPGQSLLVQGIYGSVGLVVNLLCVSPTQPCVTIPDERDQFHYLYSGLDRPQETPNVRCCVLRGFVQHLVRFSSIVPPR